ncbi:MAG: hypothetical protein IPK17_00085 [Chloroflexi bacterium]|uniref:hypothetical protein n=1 Tax=Candidatus Flexifilum breve TaxID=3140694 RepID=UPI003134A8FA|nr:hypothetical protein [Chloroflexota bacterium]
MGLPPAELAHPLAGPQFRAHRTVSCGDRAPAWGETRKSISDLVDALVQRDAAIIQEFLAPLHPAQHPLVMAGFGLLALAPAPPLPISPFAPEAVRGLFAGLSAHAIGAAGTTGHSRLWVDTWDAGAQGWLAAGPRRIEGALQTH